MPSKNTHKHAHSEPPPKSNPPVDISRVKTGSSSKKPSKESYADSRKSETTEPLQAPKVHGQRRTVKSDPQIPWLNLTSLFLRVRQFFGFNPEIKSVKPIGRPGEPIETGMMTMDTVYLIVWGIGIVNSALFLWIFRDEILRFGLIVRIVVLLFFVLRVATWTCRGARRVRKTLHRREWIPVEEDEPHVTARF
jgi:hypothetical protein